MIRRRRAVAAIASVLGTAALVMLVAGVAVAQDELVIDGRVLWIAGSTMVVAPSMSYDSAVNVDLSHTSEDEYMRLTTGDFVTITGTIADDGNRVIATSIRTRS
jgi:hypothetical protein